MNYRVENRQQLPHHGHQGCHLVREGQATVLHIRISGGTGAGPDEVGWLFHRLS